MKTKLFTILLVVCSGYLYSQSKIIDHTCTDIKKIPSQYINLAKSTLNIRYWHASHGTHLMSGMGALTNYSPAYDDLYSFGNTGADGPLKFNYTYPTLIDLENDAATWYQTTRTYLSSNQGCNVVMWAWCNIYNQDIQYYLDHMEDLMAEYGPGGTAGRTNPVQFVFMTGHGNIDSMNEDTYNRNKIIRDYCKTHDVWFYDFNDIECYDPDGNYFGDGNLATGDYTGEHNLGQDGSYNLPGGGRGNVGNEWMAENPLSELTALAQNGVCVNCAHSDGAEDQDNSRLHCVLKGQAAWWLWARLAGWDGGADTSSVNGILESSKINLNIIPNPATQTIKIQAQSNIVNGKLAIYDLSGRELLINMAYNNGDEIVLKGLSSGMYIVKIVQNSTTYTGNFIKQ